MRVAVPREIAAGECRVALVPETVGRLSKAGFELVVEAGAGERAGFPDSAYVAAGALIESDPVKLFGTADAVLKIQRPGQREDLGRHEASLLRRGSAVVSFLYPYAATDTVLLLADGGVASFAMELVPRITRAQKMDALSSQSTVAGYKAVLLAANATGKFFPMLMTAAGTIPPARLLVIGAGVAGLQAIATARRLGAVVEAFDVRAAAKEQVQSLGAAFVDLDLPTADAQDAGGYAKELAADHIRREKELLHDRCVKADIVITTALVPGKRAPVLVPADTVRAMRYGSVIVDLAGEMGGNCELAVPGQTVVENGVTILAPLNLSSEMAYHASTMYSRNIQALLEHLAPERALKVDLADEITGGCCVTYDGQVVHEPTRALLNHEVSV